MSERYCIIGAGASGLAVAKTFVARGIPSDLLERETDIGGLASFIPAAAQAPPAVEHRQAAE